MEEKVELLATDEQKQVVKKSKSRKIKFSVKLKFSILVAVLLSLATIIVSFYILSNAKKELLSEMRLRAKIIAENTAGNLKEILDDDITRHQIIVETKKKEIEYISIINNEGYLIDHSDDEIWNEILRSKIEDSKLPQPSGLFNISLEEIITLIEPKFFNFVNSKNIPLYEIFVPIKFGGTKLSTLRIAFSELSIIKKIKQIQFKVIIFVIIAMIIAIILSYLVSIFVVRPIKKLSEGARIIGTGNLGYKIEIKNQDELGQLADEFNSMTEELQVAQKSIIEREKLEEQLQIAQKIQQSLMPDKFPEIREVDIFATYKPARGVGGDYYDILHIKERNQIGAIIADVSGKGIPAALIMVMIRTIFNSYAHLSSNTSEVLSTINNNISGGITGEKYATMFYFIYDYKVKKLIYSNGAHNPILIYKNQTIEEYDTEGMPVGITPDVKFGQAEIPLLSGDIVVMFTDGITEAMNEKHNLFSVNRLKESITKFHNFSAKDLTLKILSEISEFVGTAPQNDDMTLFIMKIR